MIRVQDIYDIINGKFPVNTAADGDKVGLIVGSQKNEITKVVLAVDPSYLVIDFAIENGAQLILTHHSIYLNGNNFITDEDEAAKKILKLANHNLNLISMHTNLDIGEGGLNDLLCEKLGISKDLNLCGGFLKGGKVENTTLRGFIDTVKSALNPDFVLAVGNENDLVSKVMVSSGAASSMTKEAKKAGSDLFFTGELKHDDANFARENGMCALAVGHFATEVICTEIYYDLLQEKFNGLEILIAPEVPSVTAF